MEEQESWRGHGNNSNYIRILRYSIIFLEGLAENHENMWIAGVSTGIQSEHLQITRGPELPLSQSTL
jgi:hypothetical protein